MVKIRPPKNHKYTLAFLILSGLILVGAFSFIVFGYSNRKDIENTVLPAVTANQDSVAIHYQLPVRLSIPKLNVDTDIISVGTTASGNMDTPSNDQDVGWYDQGPYPGNEGSSVIAGHVGIGGSAVFMNLDQLRVGDTMQVIDSNGQTASFIVREIKIYAKDEQPTEVFSNVGGSRLNLITCTGAWEEDQQTFSHRLVVFSDAVN